MNKGVLKAESRCVGKHTTVNLSSSSSSKRTPRTGQHGNDSEEKSRSQSHDGEVDFADTSEANSTKGESFLSPDSLSSSLRLDQQSQVTFGGEEDKSQPPDDDYATASVDPNFYQQVHFTPSRHATPSSVYSPYSPHSPFSPFTYATSGNVVFFQDSQARPDLVPQQYSQLDNPNLTAELDPGMFDEAYARTLYNSDVLQFNGNLNEVHAVVGAVQQSVNDLMEVVAYDDCHEGDRQRYAEMFNNAFDPDALIRQHMMELSAEDFVMYNAVNILTQEGIRAAAEFDEDEPPALEQMPSNHHSPLYPMYPQYQQYPQTFAAPTPIPRFEHYNVDSIAVNQASFRWLTVQNETSSERLVIVDNEQNTALDGDFGFNFTTTLLNYNAETKKFSYVYDKTISCFVIRRKRDRELLKIEGYEEVAITSPDYLISPDKRIQWVYANYDYDYCFGFVLKQVPEAIKLRSMIIVKPRYDERTGDRLADEEIRADILQMTTRVKRVNPKTNLEEERINTIYLDCYQSLVQRQFGEFFQNNSLGEVCKAVLRPVYHDGTQVYLGMEATQGCVALKVIKGVAGNRITTMKDLEAVLQYELAIRNENVVEEIRAMSFLQSLNTPAERVLADIDSSASIAMSAFHTYEQLLCVDNKFFAITSNYAPDRCLLHYFETYYGGERPHRLSEDSTKHVLLQVVKAIHVIHQHGMVHHDLSTENILLRRISRHGRSSSSCAAADCSLPGNNCDPELFLQDMLCSLIDFGQSKAVPFDHISQSYRLMKPKLDRCVGKATFYCPELYQQGTEIEYDAFKVDVYQLGVLMFVLLFGMSPIPPRRQDSDADPLLVWFGILRDHQLGTMLVKWDIVNDQIMTKKVADCMSPMALDLLAALLSYDPRRRPSMEEVLHHPWFAGLPQSVLREVVPAMVSIPRPVHHYPISPPFLYPPSPFEAPAEVEEA